MICDQCYIASLLTTVCPRKLIGILKAVKNRNYYFITILLSAHITLDIYRKSDVNFKPAESFYNLWLVYIGCELKK